MNKNKKITTYFVIFSLLLIGIIYAILQANLQINGTAKIGANTWDIHFDNIQVNENSVSIGSEDSAATIDPENNCKVDFVVTLSLPGDFYEFTVDVVNAGTIDGMIGEINKTLKVNNEVVSDVPDYLNYNVTYDDGGPIIPNHLLEAGETLTYLVRLEFRTDIEELPEAATVLTTLEPQYIQADSGAIKKKPYYACTFDGELVQGAEYTNGQYTYRYMQEGTNNGWSNISSDGWGVVISDRSSTNPVTTRLCTSINDKPIVSMSYMFYNSQTTSIDTSSFNTSNVTNMIAMFYGCSSLSSLDLSYFNTSNVTNMIAMFYGCRSLSSLDLSYFNTSNVSRMNAMFSGCSSLTDLDLSGFDLSKASSFSSAAGGIFEGTTSLKKINMSNWKLPADMSNAIIRQSGAYYSPIEEIDVQGWDLSITTNIDGLFGTSSTLINEIVGRNLTIIKGLDSWDTSHITSMSQMFLGLSSLTTLDLSSFDMSNVTNTDYMFTGCTSLTTGYARTQTDADKFNNSSDKPSGVTFVVKS